MYTLYDFQTEQNKITQNSLLGKEINFSKLREICKDLGENINYNFRVEEDDAIFWETCNKFSRDLFNQS